MKAAALIDLTGGCTLLTEIQVPPSGPNPASTRWPELSVLETGEGGRATAVGSAFPQSCPGASHLSC